MIVSTIVVALLFTAATAALVGWGSTNCYWSTWDGSNPSTIRCAAGTPYVSSIIIDSVLFTRGRSKTSSHQGIFCLGSASGPGQHFQARSSTFKWNSALGQWVVCDADGSWSTGPTGVQITSLTQEETQTWCGNADLAQIAEHNLAYGFAWRYGVSGVTTSGSPA